MLTADLVALTRWVTPVIGTLTGRGLASAFRCRIWLSAGREPIPGGLRLPGSRSRRPGEMLAGRRHVPGAAASAPRSWASAASRTVPGGLMDGWDYPG
jgi:hypothetical protein